MTKPISQKKLNKKLIQALEKDDLSLAEEFLKAGANSNHIQAGLFAKSLSPASIAIKKDHVDMLLLLMTYDLKQNQITYFKSILHVPLVLFAALHNSKKTLKLLAEDLNTNLNVTITGSDQVSMINMTDRKQLLGVSTFRTAALNIIKNAVPVRAEKERILKQQKIRRSKFKF